jgi:bifunctional DNA-binding transcriptional regulator/antitoxin component of YhaV-PrlF toxin-antitoxin module
MQTRALPIVGRVNPKRRVTIPIEFALRYKLDDGDHVIWTDENGFLKLKKLELEESAEQAVAA